MAYPAADAAVAFAAVYFIAQDKQAAYLRLVSPFSHVASAFLVILAASLHSGWTMTLNQAASSALPFLAAHPSGYTLFQLASALSVYRLLHSSANPLQSALCVLLHIYLALANLDCSSQTQVASVIRNISFTQVRQLNATQKLRKLTMADLWQLPERYQLRNAYADLVINTGEPFFLFRAIVRTIWKPMIPIHVARMLFQTVPIVRAILNGLVYQCLDSSENSGFYKAYMAAAGLILVELLEGQKLHLSEMHEWDPKSGSYRPGDNVGNIYFSTKTVKMFGWERMYLDPRLKKSREYLNRLPWYASLVRLGLTAVDIVETVVTDLSMYATVAMYLQTLSAGDNFMTNSKLLEMADHIDTLRSNIIQVYYGATRLSYVCRCANDVEPLFQCETFDTISHAKIDECKAMPSIHLDNCSFRWKKKASILKKVTFKAAGNDLVAVIGKTGSGKSSLLLALCRELEMIKGAGKVVGRIGYLEQSPWIMNDTMRANILFGREFDEEYYRKVIHACALTRDIESWPGGDLTLIGERGINISGGQRARLALARTVYSRADVYILDDPLSAVDAHVKRHILDNVILSSGLLGNSLRVVTTHAESMLPFCNQIITVSDRTVSVVHQEPKEHIITTPVSASDTPTACDATPNKTDADSVSGALIADYIMQTDTENATQADGPELAKEKEQPKEWTLWENAKYVFNLCGWHVFILFVVTASLRPVSDFILDGYNIAALKENAKSDSVSHDAVLWYLKVRLLKAATREILIVIESSICKMLSDDKIEDTIQEKFVHSLLYAPMSLLEKADRFKISSAFNEGSRAMAYGIPRYLRAESSNAFESVLSIWRAAQATPQFMLIVPFVVWARTRASKLTETTSDSVGAIEKEVSSKHSQTSSIIEDGSLMIRLFGVEPYFMSRYISDQDEEAKINEPIGSLGCLSNVISDGIRDTGKIISLFSVIIQSHMTKYRVSSGQMKVLRSDVADLIYNIGRLVDMPSRLKTFSKDVGAFRQFSDLEAEGPYIVEDYRVPSEWPHSGNVEFKNLSIKYGTGQDHALKNLNVAIRPGEKIGIVGRTGAGKSTLAKTIFRLLNENVEGSIEIDGHDIA
ncbi:Multidrug resistance-associated protein 1, partial [Coemansia sp. BCRC 34962]